VPVIHKYREIRLMESADEKRRAPYGSWESPIRAVDVANTAHPVESAVFADGEIWWAERRPTEAGRTAIYRRGHDGAIEELLARPSSARSRVHEYGGGAWAATSDRRLVYVEAADQRLRLIAPGNEAMALTPEADGVAYGDISVHGENVIAVREITGVESPYRDIVSIPLDGSASADPKRIVSIVAGSDFLAYPRISADGRSIAWIAWSHPEMPWDGTELRVAALDREGVAGAPSVLLGGRSESVLQPEWRNDSSLWVLTDATGFWNPVLVHQGGSVEPLQAQERDTGGPLWGLAARWYLPVETGELLLVSTFGDDRLELLRADGTRRVIATPFTAIDIQAIQGQKVLIHGGSPTTPSGLFVLDLETEGTELVRSDFDTDPDAAYLPEAQMRTFAGVDRDVHAIVYPPRNPHFAAPDGELPPYVTFVHGGPTAHSRAAVNLVYAFYTSRGIGVLDVNYGGSTGYGRAYRERLKGEWGVVDVEDVQTAALGLADAGLADPARLAIEGGSAGGWTVLAALVRGSVFACGISLYGVADLRALAEFTHDFESHYTDGLVGPLPEAEQLYIERSPLSAVDRLNRPVLLLQGLEDRVVPPAQSEMFRDAMVAAGVPHAYLTFEGEGHGFRRAETKTRVREAALSFYAQVFGFGASGVPQLELWHPESREAS